MSTLDRYVASHGRYPRTIVPNGKDGEVELSVAPGYVTITFHQSSRQAVPHTIYISRNAWIKLLRFALPLTKYMDRQFSVQAAISAYSRAEAELLRGLRQMKKARR